MLTLVEKNIDIESRLSILILVHEASNIYGDITVDQKKTNPPI